jgi:P pilus assembly chaperone PapD
VFNLIYNFNQSQSSSKFKTILLLIVITAAVFMFSSNAAARIFILPTRAIMEEGDRTFTFRMLNNGEEASTYRIGIENMIMNEEGRLIRADSEAAPELEDNQFLAKDLIQFSPRQVTIAPEGEQIIRLQMLPRADMEAGEYRAHIQFQEIPDESSSTESDGANDSISIGLKPVYGFSVPVIYRHGSTSVNIDLENISVEEEDDSYQLKLDLKRSGNSSAYGSIEVYHIAEDGREQQIGKQGGIAIYTEIDERTEKVKLNFSDIESPKAGRLHIIYKNREPNRDNILAEAYLENW